MRCRVGDRRFGRVCSMVNDRHGRMDDSRRVESLSGIEAGRQFVRAEMAPGRCLMRDKAVVMRHAAHRRQGMGMRLQLLGLNLGAAAGKGREPQRPGNQDSGKAHKKRFGDHGHLHDRAYVTAGTPRAARCRLLGRAAYSAALFATVNRKVPDMNCPPTRVMALHCTV